jgi:Homeodomain
MYRPETHYQSVDPSTRTLTSLPPLTSLSNNIPSWTRRSKSSAQSDESFSAYLQHPSSSSPALDRVLDGRYAAPVGMTNVSSTPTPLTRRMPSLDSIGYAQERNTPFHHHQRTPSLLEKAVNSATRGAFHRVPSWHESSPRDGIHLSRIEHMKPYASETRFRIGESLRSSSTSMSDELVGDQSVDLSTINFDQTGEDESGEADISQGSANSADSRKKRRRTDKREANILASVFEQSAFPDVRTREALARSLGMSIRAVSIWFQNRRQAMKKRATRFGGIDGIRGASVTVNGPNVSLDDASINEECAEDEYLEDDTTEEAIPTKSGLKRWFSLDEIAAHASFAGEGIAVNQKKICTKEEDDKSIEAQVQKRLSGCHEKKISAPILELVRKRSGNSLQRIASMPSLVMALDTVKVDKAPEPKTNTVKDLRDVLNDLVASRMAKKMRKSSQLTRSVSMNDARKPTMASKLADNVVDMPKPLDVLSSAPMGKPLQEKGGVDEATIWQRMQSSSSGLSSETTPESDKENRDTSKKDGEDEDEEKTLRRIAQKRALRQQFKRQQSLSKEGLEYLQQADARIALQQKQDAVKERPPLAPLSSEIKSTPNIRSALARVASLDFEAGRDRSKAVERIAMMDVANSLKDRIRQHNKSRLALQKHSRRSTENHKVNRLQGKVHSHASHKSLTSAMQSRPFRPANSMPTLMRSVSDVGQESVREGKHSSRETSASLGSSEDWTDSWTREAKRKVSEVVQGHDDSGFFGSDEGENENVDPKKRKLTEKAVNIANVNRSPFKSIQPLRQRASSAGDHVRSSSPVKRGDDRDRLAAETLLAFGSHS